MDDVRLFELHRGELLWKLNPDRKHSSPVLEIWRWKWFLNMLRDALVLFLSSGINSGRKWFGITCLQHHWSLREWGLIIPLDGSSCAWFKYLFYVLFMKHISPTFRLYNKNPEATHDSSKATINTTANNPKHSRHRNKQRDRPLWE